MANMMKMLIFFIIFNTIINSSVETEQYTNEELDCGVSFGSVDYYGKLIYECGSYEGSHSYMIPAMTFKDSNRYLLGYRNPNFKGEVKLYTASNPSQRVSASYLSSSYHIINSGFRGPKTDSDIPRHGCARFYRLCEYSNYGNMIEYCYQGNELSGSTSFPFQSNVYASQGILSIKLGPNTSVILDVITRLDNVVPFITVDKNVPCLVKERIDLVGYYKNIKTIEVKKHEKADDETLWEGQSFIYERENYYGTRKIKITTDVEKFNPPWPVRSIRMSDNSIVVINDQNDYKGNTYVFKKSTPFIPGIWAYSIRSDFLGNNQPQDWNIPQEGAVFFYEYCGFRGRKMEHKSDKNIQGFNPISINTLNFRPHSVKVAKWTTLKLYQYSNFRGTMAWIQARNVECMAEDSNLQVKELWKNSWSAQINIEDHEDDSPLNEGCARIYEGQDFYGKFFELCANYSSSYFNTREWKTGSNEPIFYGQSIRLYPNTIVVLFNNEFKTFLFKESVRNFDSQLQNKVKIMKIENSNNYMSTYSTPQELRHGCIALYTRSNFRGTQTIICKDQANLGDFNLNVGSMRVGMYTSVEFYVGVNYSTYLNFIRNESFSPTEVNSGPHPVHRQLYRSFSSIKLIKLDYPDPETPKEGRVFFYNRWNHFVDKRLELNDTLGTTIFNTRSLKFNNTAIIEDFSLQSFKLGTNTRIIFYSKDDMIPVTTNESINVSKNTLLTDLAKSNSHFNFRIELINYPLKDDKKEPEENCIKIYEHCGYQGTSKEICTSKEYYEWYKLYPGSIKIGKNIKVTLYMADKYLGSGFNIEKNSECLFLEKSNLKFYYKLIRSIKLEIINEKNWEIDDGLPLEGCAFFYKGCEFRGPRLELCGDAQSFPEVTRNSTVFNYDNDISSFKIGGNTQVTLYDGRAYAGENTVFIFDKRCLLDDVDPKIPKWHNFASSTKISRIVPKSCALLFQYPDFRVKPATEFTPQGSPVQICPGDKDYIVKGELVNFVRSILLGEGTKLLMYTYSNDKDVITITKDTPKLDVITYLTGYKGTIVITAL